MTPRPNNITGANADGKRRFQIRALSRRHRSLFPLGEMNTLRLSLQVFVLAALGWLVGCASVSQLSKREVRREALRDASAAISTGHLYICEAGTFDTHQTPAITEGQSHLVDGLPRKRLPGGCTNPEAGRSIAYAEVFNREIVNHLSQKP
jgi:hypothetical protein